MSENQSHARVTSPSSAMMRLSLSADDLKETGRRQSNQETNLQDDMGDAAVKQRLLDTLHRPENACCADCNAPSPKWATVTHGGFICTQCAGVHRSLGVHISFVLSCTLDKWTDAQVKVVETTGNDTLNDAMEFCVPTAYAKPHGESARVDRERFIRAKYEHELFKASAGKTKTQAVTSSSSSSSSSSGHAHSPVRDDHTPTSERKKSSLLSSFGELVGHTRKSLTSLRSPSPASSASPTTVPPAAAAAAGMVEYVGVLVIELVQGMELAGMDINGKSDPYVVFRLGEQTITSKRVDNDVNPQWRETLMLSWDGASPLIADVFDYNTISNDRPMGSVLIDAETLAPLLASPSSAHSRQQQGDARDEIDAVFPLLMPRIWARNFGEHMVAGAEGITKGIYRGITGVWKDPIKGAKENGVEGFAKGVGIGVAGVVYRPIKGLGTMVKETARSVGVGRKRSVEGDDDLVEAGCLHLKLRLQRF